MAIHYGLQFVKLMEVANKEMVHKYLELSDLAHTVRLAKASVVAAEKKYAEAVIEVNKATEVVDKALEDGAFKSVEAYKLKYGHYPVGH